jgi:hypothetical protein
LPCRRQLPQRQLHILTHNLEVTRVQQTRDRCDDCVRPFVAGTSDGVRDGAHSCDRRLESVRDVHVETLQELVLHPLLQNRRLEMIADHFEAEFFDVHAVQQQRNAAVHF